MTRRDRRSVRRGTTHRLLTTALAAHLAAACSSSAEPPDSLQFLDFDTLYAIGQESGEPWEAFAGIWDLEVDGEGRIALLDLGGPAVHIFDDHTRHLGSMDEPGLDPGQIDDPIAISWRAAHELLVFDPGSSWISRVTARGSYIEYEERWRAFAFGETGFCARGDRTYLSYFGQDGSIIHRIGTEGIEASFGAAPDVAGAQALGPDLREIAMEELTPSALLCTEEGVLDVGFVQSSVRLHDWDGTEVWSRELDDFRPIVAYSDDGIGLGRAFDAGEGSHLLRSVVPWGRSRILVQHQLRTAEIPEEGGTEVLESRLLSLEDGRELDRSRALPLILATDGPLLYVVSEEPFPRVTIVEVR